MLPKTSLKLSKSKEVLINNFIESENLEWLAAAEFCFDQCLNVSTKLVEYLGLSDIEAKILILTGPKFKINGARAWNNCNEDKNEWVHFVVQVDEFIVDLTARQFSTDLNFPNITRLSKIQKMWNGKIPSSLNYCLKNKEWDGLI